MRRLVAGFKRRLTVSSGSSGNGTAGGDFEFLFTVLPGDVDHSNVVNSSDYLQTKARTGRDVTSPYYAARYDIDGSGLVESSDWQTVFSLMGTSTPSGQPAGISNDAPTTQGFALVDIDNDAIDVAISLYDAFDDLEDTDSEMTYEIIDVSDPSLLDTLSIDTQNGNLVVSTASNAGSARTTVTVRATDSSGLSVDASVSIDVNRDNQPPQINSFGAELLQGNTWVLYGYLTDPDDDVAGWTVTFFGVFDDRVTVGEDGYFELTVILDNNESGTEWAVTSDPHSLESNQPSAYLLLT